MNFEQVINQLFIESEHKFKKDFAKQIGVSKQNLFNYMNGKSEPSFSEACRIVMASGTKELAIINKFKINEKIKKKSTSAD